MQRVGGRPGGIVPQVHLLRLKIIECGHERPLIEWNREAGRYALRAVVGIANEKLQVLAFGNTQALGGGFGRGKLFAFDDVEVHASESDRINPGGKAYVFVIEIKIGAILDSQKIVGITGLQG